MSKKSFVPSQAFEARFQETEWTRVKVKHLSEIKPVFGMVISAEIENLDGDHPVRALVVGTRLGNIAVFEKTGNGSVPYQFYTAIIPDALKTMNLLTDKDYDILTPAELDRIIGVTGPNIGEVLENYYLLFKCHEAYQPFKQAEQAKIGFLHLNQAAELLKEASSNRILDLAPVDMADVAAQAIVRLSDNRFSDLSDTNKMMLIGNIASVIRQANIEQQEAEEAGLTSFVKNS